MVNPEVDFDKTMAVVSFENAAKGAQMYMDRAFKNELQELALCHHIRGNLCYGEQKTPQFLHTS